MRPQTLKATQYVAGWGARRVALWWRRWCTRLLLIRHLSASWHSGAVTAARGGATYAQIRTVLQALAVGWATSDAAGWALQQGDGVRRHALVELPRVLQMPPVCDAGLSNVFARYCEYLTHGWNPGTARVMLDAELPREAAEAEAVFDGEDLEFASQLWKTIRRASAGDPAVLDAWLAVPDLADMDLDEIVRLAALVGGRAPRFAAAGITWEEARRDPDSFTDEALATLAALAAGTRRP